MSLWRQFTRGARVLARRQSNEQDIADEVSSYLEHSVDELVAGGLSPEQARRTVQLEFGSAAAVREQVRSYGWENMADTVFDSVRFALRRLLHSPGFTAVSLLMLALGIGASTAIFSIVDGVLLQPLPYGRPEQLVTLRHTAPGVHIDDLNIAPSLYFTYRDENRVFRDLGMWSTSTSSVTGIGQPEQADVLMVTASLLSVLETRPEFGRGFTAADEKPKGPATLLLTDGYWRSHYGGSRSILGRRITVDGISTEVIGILPPSFQFMDQSFALVMPLQIDRAEVRLVNFSYQGVGRLKPGVTIAQANADLSRMVPMAPAKFPPNPGLSLKAFTEARIGPNLLLLRDDLVGDSGNALWVLMGTVLMVLLIACANVANLSLVRADGRHQELAVRAALGAGRVRLASELLLESVILALAGGALGLAVAFAALRALIASQLADLPRLAGVSINPRVVAFTLGISLASGLVFGLIPVLKYARPSVWDAVKSGGRTLSQSKDRHRARSVLVIVQVALALVLLVSSGLMIRTFQALHNIDPGFSGAKQVQTLGISIPESEAKDPERVIRMEQDILRKLEGVPSASDSAITSTVPMDGGSNDVVYAADHVYREGTLPAIRRFKFVSPGYVSVIGSRLIAGRDLTWAETYARMPVALISENLAREWWGDPRAAIGKLIRPTPTDDWRRVVGVVADLHDQGVDRKAPTIVYWPLLQNNFDSRAVQVARNVAFVVRTPRAGSTALLADIRRAVWSVNPDLPVANPRTLQSVYDRSLARTSFTLLLLAIAGGMALLLGVVGIYGVIAYAVSQRTRDIGIRLALGAPLREVTGMFVRHGLALSGIGATCGLVCAFALTRLMKALLFDVSPADPLTYGTVAVVLMGAVLLASYLPARRAAKIDPVEALRAE